MLKFKGFSHGLKNSLALVPKVIIVMLAFLLMIVTSCMYVSNMLNQHLERDAIDALTNTKLQIESELLAPEMTLQLISQAVRDMIIDNTSEEEISQYLHDIKEYSSRDETSLLLINEDVYGFFDVFGGSLLIGSGNQLPDSFTPEERPWYQAAVASGGEVAITAPYISATKDSEVITYARRIFDDGGNPLGILCVDALFTGVDNDIESINITDGSYGVLLDEKLDFILHPDPSFIGKNVNQINEAFSTAVKALDAENDLVKYEKVNYAGIVTISFAEKLDNGWILSVDIPKHQYFHELYAMRLVVIILGAVLAAVLIIILMRLDSQRYRANERTQIMLDSMPLGVSFIDSDFNWIDCNQEMAKMFGLSGKHEYLERFKEFTPQVQPCGRSSEEMMFERLGVAYVKGYDRFEWMHQSLDGEPIPCEKTLVRIKHHRDNNILVYTRDLRELKAAIAMMREVDEHTELMFEATPLSCSLWDSDCNIIDCNQESARLFNLTDKSDFMENFLNLSPEYQPCGLASRDKAREIIEKAFTDGFCRCEWMHRTLDGETLPCEVILVCVKHKSKPVVAAYIRDMREVSATLEAMRKAEDDLRTALTIAENSAKVKSEFLDNMNHELRTPMNGVLGFLHIALKHEMPEKQRENIEKAENSAKDLMKIIDNILDFTIIEDKKMTMNSTPFRLADVFSEISQTYALPAKARGLTLSLGYPADLPDELVGDPQKLKQVLSSLIDNAVKFTHSGKVTVRAKMKSQNDKYIELEFYVRDTGIGMTQEHMKELFTPFSQANTSSTRHYGGTGISLALSKHLVTLLGGRIWAESEYGEGSTFRFSVRFHLPGTMAESPAQTRVIPDDLPAAQETNEQQHDPEEIHVLLVEDNEVNQIIACELLSSMDYIVDVANNGQEAIDMLALGDYNIVLMDIQMPVMDGLTATQKIREKNEYKNLPIIAVSAHSLPADKEKSLDCGMNDHITKPIDPAILNTTIHKWLSKIPA